MSIESASKTKALIEVTDGAHEVRPLGSVGIDESGHIFRKNESGVYNFTFVYKDYQFAVKAETRPNATRLRIHAVLGHLPYTAESAELRVNMQAIVHAAGRALGGRVQVNREQRVMLLDEFNFDAILTPGALLSKTVGFLFLVKPYLELLDLIAGATRAVHAMLPPPPSEEDAEGTAA